MERIDRMKLAVEKGYTCDPETGKIFNKKLIELKGICSQGYKLFSFKHEDEQIYIKGHHFIWYWVNKEVVTEIDHINCVRHDNRISNLRSVTRQQNQWNRFGKGFHFHKKRNKWQASITINKKGIYLGMFNTEEEARAAYLKAKEKYHVI
jgi:hypothetical protein